jgi:pSer/pThr/pTyr-binding forkhead associated (FHA) protein
MISPGEAEWQPQAPFRGSRVRETVSELVFIEERPAEGRERPARAGTTIGRAGCDVELKDPDVSRRHAVVRRVDTGLAIEDLGSTNGTFVNERRISGIVELAVGDRIRFGNTVWGLAAGRAAGGDVPT